MVTQELLSYIQKQLESRADGAAIKKTLLSSGWSEQDIDTALEVKSRPIPSAGQSHSSNRRRLPITKLLLAAFLILFIWILFRRASFLWKRDVIKEDNTQELHELARKTQKEYEERKRRELVFEKTVGLNEEFDIEFLIKAWKQHDIDPKDVKIELDSEKIFDFLKGKMRFRVREYGTRDVIDRYYGKTEEGKVYHFVVFEFWGDSANPQGEYIGPASIMDNVDPAPQMVLISEEKIIPCHMTYSRSLSRVLGFENKYELNQGRWVSFAEVWHEAADLKPIIALEYIGMDRRKYYIKVEVD